MRVLAVIAAMSLAALLGGCACLTPPSEKAVKLEQPIATASGPSLGQGAAAASVKRELFGSI